MLGTKNRRCEDCGRSFKWEKLCRVVWTYRERGGQYQEQTTLQLCWLCARHMAQAFKGDETSTLAFHAI